MLRRALFWLGSPWLPTWLTNGALHACSTRWPSITKLTSKTLFKPSASKRMCHIRSLACNRSNIRQLRRSSKNRLHKFSIRSSWSSQSRQRLRIRKISKAFRIMWHRLKSGKTQDQVILALKGAINLLLIKKMPCRSQGRHQFRRQLFHLTPQILDQLPKPLSLLSRRNQRKIWKKTSIITSRLKISVENRNKPFVKVQKIWYDFKGC